MISDAGELWSRRRRRLLATLASLVPFSLYLLCFSFEAFVFVLSSAINGGAGSRRHRCRLHLSSTVVLLLLCSPPPHLMAAAFQTTHARSETLDLEANMLHTSSEGLCSLPQSPWTTSASSGSRVGEDDAICSAPRSTCGEAHSGDPLCSLNGLKLISCEKCHFRLTRSGMVSRHSPSSVPPTPPSHFPTNISRRNKLSSTVVADRTLSSDLMRFGFLKPIWFGLVSETPNYNAHEIKIVSLLISSFESIRRKNICLTLPRSNLASKESTPTRLRSERNRRRGFYLPATNALLTVSVNPADEESVIEIVWRVLTESTKRYDIRFQFNPATVVKPISLDIKYVGRFGTVKHLHGLKTCSIFLMAKIFVYPFSGIVKLESSKAFVAFAPRCNEPV